MNVYVDTNAWIKCAEWGIDILDELDRIVKGKVHVIALDQTLNELKRFKSGVLGENAKLALTIIEKQGVAILDTGAGHVDDLLVEHATEEDYVLTQDAELKKRLRKNGVRIIVIRQKKRLQVASGE